MVEVRLSARCFRTEDRQKIVAGIKALFPDARVEGEDPILASSESVDRFGELLRQERIRDAARSVMRKGISGGGTRFMLNKQVAAVGKVSFSQESHPLGDIEVTILDENIDALIDRIAPRTRKKEGAGA
jgi:predicted RNA binding protein with dsRBD fold (UPF0201 family)